MHTNDADVKRIALTAYPDYKGQKFQVVVSSTVNVQSYWDGGSRSFFKFVRLDGSTDTLTVPPQSAYDPQITGADAVPLVPGLACVEHVIFCGKDMGIRIHVHADNAPKLLPALADLTDDEKTVLVYTKSLKSSYNGISNFRYHEAHRRTNITLEQWDAAKASLIAKGLLNKAGALTNEGRNVAEPLRKGMPSKSFHL